MSSSRMDHSASGETIIQRTCREACQVFGVEHSGLVLRTPGAAVGYVAAEYPDWGIVQTPIPIQGIPFEEALFERRQPVVLADVATADGLGEVGVLFRRLGLRSVLMTPIIVGGQVVGSFSLDAVAGPRDFSPQIELCQWFADQVARDVENDRLLAEHDRRVNQLERLVRANNDIMSRLGHVPLDEMLHLIARRAVETLGAAAGSILLVTRPGELTLVADHGYPRPMAAEQRKFTIQSGAGLGLTGYIAHEARRGEPFNAHGAALNDHWAARTTEQPEARLRACYSLLVMPLFAADSDRLIGLLRVENRCDDAGRPDPSLFFTTEDEWLIRLLADVVVVAIQRADLFDQLTRQKDLTSRLITVAPYGVIAIDDHGRVTTYNAAAQAILGYAPDEVLGQRVDMLYANPNEPIRIGNLLSRSPYGRLSNEATSVRRRPDAYDSKGAEISIRLSATWLLDVNGRQVGSVGYFQDMRYIEAVERRLALLLDASTLVAQSPNLQDALDRLAELLTQRLRVPFGRAFLLDDEALPPDVILLGSDGTGANAPYNPPDGPLCASHETALRLWQTRLELPDELHSLLLMPLQARGRIVGLLCLGDRRPQSSALFDTVSLELTQSVADTTAALIDRLRLQEETERHRDLLDALDMASRVIRAEKETERLLPEVVRQAAVVLRLDAGALFRHNPHLGVLTLEAIHNLPAAWLGRTLRLGEDLLISQVAERGQVGIALGRPLLSEAKGEATPRAEWVALPIKLAGNVAAVLAVGSASPNRRLRGVDVDTLRRFASQASLALRYAQTLSQGERTARQLENLQQISSFMQTTADADKLNTALLTGITAGYGLAFNRAALFLVDEVTGRLVYRKAIGHINAAAAALDWEASMASSQFNIPSALADIAQGKLDPTPIELRMRERNLMLPLAAPECELLNRVLASGYCHRLPASDLDLLPPSLRAAFDPSEELGLIIAPLPARGRAIGLIIADNKFTRAPITNEDAGLLFTYAGVGGIAIDNARRQEAQAVMASAVAALNRAAGLDNVLTTLVAEARRVLRADSAAFWYFDHDSERFILTRCVADGIPADIWADFRRAEPQKGQTAYTVMARGWIGIEDVNDGARYPFLSDSRRRLLARAGVRSMQGVVLYADGKPQGVLYANYGARRSFDDEAQAAGRTFADHAALALYKARLMAQLHKIHDTAQVIPGVTAQASLDDALRAVVMGIREVLECGPVSLYVYDAGRERLRYPPTVDGARKPAGVRRFLSIREDSIVLRLLRKGENTIVPRTAEDPMFDDSRFTRDEKIVTILAVVLKVGRDIVGIMFVNYRQEHRFTSDELETIQLFADNAAVAISLAQARELALWQAAALRAQHAVARLVTDTRDLNAILGEVAQQARALFPSATYASVSLRAGDHLVPRAAYPTRYLKRVERALATRRLSDDNNDQVAGRAGVTGRAVLTGQTQRVADVSKIDYHISINRRHKGAELAVPIMLDGQALGVLNVEHPEPHAFHDLEQFALEALARQAGAAITIADQFAEQQRINRELDIKGRQLTQILIQTKTEHLLKTIIHFVGNRVLHMDTVLADIRADIDAARSGNLVDVLLNTRRRIDGIQGDLTDILQSPLVTRRPENVRPYRPRTILDSYLKRFGRKKCAAAGVSWTIDVTLDPAIRVRVSLASFRIIIDGLVENALAAMEEVKGRPKHLTLGARIVGNEVRLLVSDTGTGIDPKIIDMLFKSDLTRLAYRKGHGIGLEAARLHVQAFYGGSLDFETTGPTGTTFYIALPYERIS